MRNDKNKEFIPFETSIDSAITHEVKLNYLRNENVNLYNKLEEETITKEEFKNIIEEIKVNQYRIKEDINNYYNEEEDKEDINDYYRYIDFSNTNNLSKDLSNLIENTHHTKVGYKQARKHLYKLVDLHPDGKLKSIYCGVLKEPKQVVEEDYKTTLEINEIIAIIINNESIENIDIKIRNAFRNAKFNCEHVVCQSWFDKKLPMKGDLHHLFTCEPNCNSFRSNYIYYDFQANNHQYENHILDEQIKNECGKRCTEKEIFEPEYAKGIVARATLYFLLRYPNKIVNIDNKKIDVKLMIKWHKEFPVTLYEKHRNSEIYKIQGNRNPLIDFPEIDFDINV